MAGSIHGWNPATKVWTPMINIGVTDGSNAAPGQIGEYIKTTNNENPTPVSVSAQPDFNSYIQVAQISLPPGDWDVEAALGTYNAVLVVPGFNAVEFGLVPPGMNPATETFNWPDGWYQADWASDMVISLSSTRVLTATHMGLILWYSGGYNLNIWYTIRARRMR